MIAGVLERGGALPKDGPVNWDLGPDHNTQLISLFNHEFIVRIVRQADKISAQLLSPSEQGYCILPAIGTSSTKRRLFMYADATQEDWPAVQQYLRAPGFYAAEANLILHAIGFRFDRHLVEFGIVWRPQS